MSMWQESPYISVEGMMNHAQDIFSIDKFRQALENFVPDHPCLEKQQLASKN